MAWTIEFDKAFDEQLRRLDAPERRRIEAYLADRVVPLEDPRMLGKPLVGEKFGDLWRYRVGDYRVVCQLQHDRLVVLALAIGHRRDIDR